MKSQQSPTKSARKHRVCCNSALGYTVSFRCVFVMLCVVQVIVACLAVWAAGYDSVKETADSLSKSLFVEILADAREQMDAFLTPKMPMADSIAYQTRIRFPNLGSLQFGANQTGLWTDLSALVLGTSGNNSDIAGFGCGNSAGTLFFSATANNANGLALYVYEFLDSTSPQARIYTLNCSSPSQASQLWCQTGFGFLDPSQSPNDLVANGILTFTGLTAPTSVQAQAFYQAGLYLNGSTGWQQGVSYFPGSSFVAVVKPFLYNNRSAATTFQSPYNTSLTYEMPEGICGITIQLTRLSEALVSLPFGVHGSAVLLQGNGDLIASSLGADTVRSQNLAAAVHNTLVSTGAFSSGGPNPYRYYPAPQLNFYGVTVFEGSGYTLTATNLNTPGLNWIVAVLTKDSDFDSELQSNVETAALITIGIVVLSIFCTLYLAYCFTLPLMRLVTFMEDLTRVVVEPPPENPESTVSTKAVAESRRQLLKSWLHHPFVLRKDASIETFVAQHPGSKDGSQRLSYKEPPWWLRCLQCNPLLRSCSRIAEVTLMQETFGRLLLSLCESAEQIDKTNDAKRQFSRYVFHEIRVPFHIIALGITQLRSETRKAHPSHEEIEDALLVIEEQSEVVGRILNDVLSLSKLEQGAFQLEFRPFDVEQLVMQTVRSFQSAAIDRRIEMVIKIESLESVIAIGGSSLQKRGVGVLSMSSSNNLSLDLVEKVQGNVVAGKIYSDGPVDVSGKASSPDDDPKPVVGNSQFNQSGATAMRLLGDEFRLKQVIANFISNALKFTPEKGRITVTVSFSLARHVPSRQTALSPILGDKKGRRLHRSSGSFTLDMPDISAEMEAGQASSPVRDPEAWKKSGGGGHGARAGGGFPLCPEHCDLCQDHKNSDDLSVRRLSGREKTQIELSTKVLRPRPVQASTNDVIWPTPPRRSDRQPIVMVDEKNTKTCNLEVTRTHEVLAGAVPISSASSNNKGTRSDSVMTMANLQAYDPEVANVQKTIDQDKDRHDERRQSHLSHASSFSTQRSLLPESFQLKPSEHSQESLQRAESFEYKVPATGIDKQGLFSYDQDRSTTIEQKWELSQSVEWVDLSISVEDSGVGISPANMARLFQPYSQFAAGELQRGQGTGLGLSIAKSLVNLHGGQIGCFSTPGEGSTFFFTLPLQVVTTVQSARTVAGAGATSFMGEFEIKQVNPKSLNLAPAPESGDSALLPSPVSLSGYGEGFAYGSIGSSKWKENEVGMESGSEASPADSARKALLPQQPAVSLLSMSGELSPGRDSSTEHERPLILASSTIILPVSPAAAPPVGNEKQGHGQSSKIEFDTAPHSARSSDSNLGSLVAGKDSRILVVDDSPPTRKLIVKLLERIGYFAKSVENGELCVDIFKKWLEECAMLGALAERPRIPFDLILMDNFMPVMTGEQAAMALRSLGITVPIVGVTGNALNEDVRSFLDAGVNRVLTKPISKGALETALEDLLKY